MRRYAADEMLPTLSETDRTFLARFLNDAYLSPANLPSIAESFAGNSEIQLHEFLRAPLAKRVQAALSARDVKDKLNIAQRPGSAIPAHDVGKNESWEIRGPPHKARFCVLQTASESAKPSSAPELPANDAQLESLDEDTLLQILQETLLASDAFRSWLAAVSSFVPLGFQLAARRFRPGLDYTLATANEEDVRLDVLLDLTPGPTPPAKNGKAKAKAAPEEPVGWQTGEWGGWVVSLPQQLFTCPTVRLLTTRLRSVTWRRTKAKKILRCTAPERPKNVRTARMARGKIRKMEMKWTKTQRGQMKKMTKTRMKTVLFSQCSLLSTVCC